MRDRGGLVEPPHTHGPERTAAALTARLADLRVYRNVSGERDTFVALMHDETVPMLRGAGITVVAYGPSLHDEHHSFLIRSFESLAQREGQLAAFYGSERWISDYDERVMALIEAYTTAVLEWGPHLQRAIAATGGNDGSL